jgi:hypothetical protein
MTTDERQMEPDGKSSPGLWPGELKMVCHTVKLYKMFLIMFRTDINKTGMVNGPTDHFKH